ncbi:MAG TPA: PhnD/SsuA/transferrin family substrate-binding protein [Phycisphaerae bacterium]|nr:PhnD/SsuA/transferrin family substrate-binding protein [Phycisphaerae bacterium]
MPANTARVPWLLALLTPVALCGCQQPQQAGKASSGPLFASFEQLLGMKPPIRLAVTRVHINPLVAAPWQPLQAGLRELLGRDVQVLQLRAFQVRSKFERGELDVAMVSAADYVQIAGADVCSLLAVCRNPDGSDHSGGLIITADTSDVQSIEQLKGKRFAFGPRNDPILHIAAGQALVDAGVELGDLTKELLPPYGFHINSFEAAKAALYEGAAAAAVTQAEFESWPESGGLLLQGKLGRSSFRVLANTPPVPNRAFLAGAKADPKLVAKVREYLLEKVQDQPKVLESLGVGSFGQAAPDLYKPFGEMYEKVQSQMPQTGLIPFGASS